MSSGKYQLKQDATAHLLEWQIQKADTTKYWGACGAIGTLIRCWWEGNGTTTVEDSLVSYNTKHTHIIQQSYSLVFAQRSWNLCLHKTLHMDVYSSFFSPCTLSMQNFLVQGLNLHPSRDNTGSLSHWATRELHSSFIPNCQNSEATKISCGPWMDK